MPGVQWARVNGASIAYQQIGDGPDVVEVQAGAALTWGDHALTRAWPERLSEFSRYTGFDAQGCGRSDPLPAGHVPALEEKVAEAIAVMDAADVESAVLAAFFGGAPIALALAALHPQRVRSVVVINGYARLTAGAGFPDGVPAEVRAAFERDISDNFGTGWMVRRWVPALAAEPEVQAFMERYEQALSSRGQVALGARLVSDLDVRDLLADVVAGVAIIHATGNQVVPVVLARDLNQRIAGSHLREVDTANHLFTLPPMLDECVDAVRSAVGREVHQAPQVVRGLLFTDIVGSTARLSALRDAAWRELLAEYLTQCRAAVNRYGGTFIKSTGDGVLGTFPSATAAIRAAIATRAAAAEIGLSNRAAVHVGDIQESHGDIGGLAVHYAARLLDLAPDGGTVVSDAAAQCAAGQGFRFDELGEIEVRGITGTARVLRLA